MGMLEKTTTQGFTKAVFLAEILLDRTMADRMNVMRNLLLVLFASTLAAMCLASQPKAGTYVWTEDGKALAMTLTTHKSGNFTVTGKYGSASNIKSQTDFKGTLYAKTGKLSVQVFNKATKRWIPID